MLGPVHLAEVGCKPEVEAVGALDLSDMCAAAAMAEHFRRVPKMRQLALGSPDLFDVTVARLATAVMMATHGSSTVNAARRHAKAANTKARSLDADAGRKRVDAGIVPGAGFVSVVSVASAARIRRGDGVSNWARLLGAAKQGAAAHRAVQLFAWVRAALTGSEGAPHERADIVRRRDSLETLVHAAFAFTPLQHAALAPVNLDNDDDDKSSGASCGKYARDVDLTRLRWPNDGVSTGVLDLLVDVLYEVILLAHHANLVGGDQLAPRHLVAHIVQEVVSPPTFKPKVTAMFARLVNLTLRQRGSAITGGDAVRAHRCGFVLRHLLEGIDGGVVVRYIRDEYQNELKFCLIRPGVHDRKLDGDSFFEQHARAHYDVVMLHCLPPLWHGAELRRTTAQLQSAASGRAKMQSGASKMRVWSLGLTAGLGGQKSRVEGALFRNDDTETSAAGTNLAPTPPLPYQGGVLAAPAAVMIPPPLSPAHHAPGLSHCHSSFWSRRAVTT